MPTIDRSSPLPVYFQIALDLRRRIAAGEWNSGDRTAPELELASEYAVSRVTIRQALAELVKDDLLERRRGSGTYVRERNHPLVYDLNLTLGNAAARLREQGIENRADVVETGFVDDPPSELRHRLQIAAGGRAVFLVRRVIIDQDATAVYRSWFDASRVPGIQDSAGLTGSLSVVLEEDYGLVPTRSESAIEVVRSTHEETALLGSEHDAPMFVVSSTTYLADGQPLEFSQMTWLGDRVRFHVTSHSDGTLR
jgi:DNA-binding GntR family transcriptional regulator